MEQTSSYTMGWLKSWHFLESTLLQNQTMQVGHYYPSGLKNEKEIKEKLRQAVKNLGIAWSSEYAGLSCERGEIFIVDLGARMGGNIIYSHIIPEATGRDYAKEMIMQAVGESTNHQPFHKNMAVSTRLLALTPGVIEKLPDFHILKQNMGRDFSLPS